MDKRMINKIKEGLVLIFNEYKKIRYEESNSEEAKSLYHDWYDASLRFFSNHIDPKDEDLMRFKSVDNRGSGFQCFKNFTELRSLFGVLLDKANDTNSATIGKRSNPIPNKVFMVHGHDNELRESVARYVEKLGLSLTILDEKENSGRTIIQKLEDESQDASFGIVLYSPCDEGREMNKKMSLMPRARQNVVFEHGLLIGLLGQERVCHIVRGDGIELPSDCGGVLYIKYDESGGWKSKLAKELKTAGLPIDVTALL